MRMTADDLQKLRVIDRIIAEPIGGAHRHPSEAIAKLQTAIAEELEALASLDPAELRRDRRRKFLAMGSI
jgi:acetyl-CoA carboxylase carboxyl transferase subunit alpha